MQFSQLAIFGPGLIGGSLALAARRRGVCGRISVWSQRDSERQTARNLGLAETVSDDPAEVVYGADLVILCTPPAVMPSLAERIAPFLAPRAVVSDVASVKGGLVGELTDIFQKQGGATASRYVGAHPMAGAENSGLAFAKENLFEGCVCLLTPLEGRTAPAATAAVSTFWEKVGTRVRQMSPQAHDEAVALISHLPHVLAAGLADYIGGLPGEAVECAGPGWRDMTRLAGGSPEMWTEILSRNRRPVTNALQGMIEKLRGILELLEAGREAELESFLRVAKQHRAEATLPLRQRSGGEDSRT